MAVHELHHRLDDVFTPPCGVTPNHFFVSIGAADDFGEHFDGNAFILNFAFRPSTSSTSASRYLTTHEPNRFVKFVLEEK